MKKYPLLAILLVPFLVGCQTNTNQNTSSGGIVDNNPDNEEGGHDTIEQGGQGNNGEDSNPESNPTDNNNQNSNGQPFGSPSWDTNRTLLECGYYQADLPYNYKNPMKLKTTLSADTSSWSNNDMYEYMPTNFRYVYRNSYQDGPSGHRSSPTFYSNSNPGGLKIANTGVGFQSTMFEHTGEKLEIRIGISQVNNASGNPQKNKDTVHIYFFNKQGQLITISYIEENTITASTNELKIYLTDHAKEVNYFEFRVNAMPYKGSQCYNFGVGYCNFKSWERA